MKNSNENFFDENNAIKTIAFIFLCILTLVLFFISMYSFISFIDVLAPIVTIFRDSDIFKNADNLQKEVIMFFIMITFFMFLTIIISIIFIAFIIAKKKNRLNSLNQIVLFSVILFIISAIGLYLLKPTNASIVSQISEVYTLFVKFSLLIYFLMCSILFLYISLFKKNKNNEEVTNQ